MSINLQTGGYIAPQSLLGASSTDIQVAQKQSEHYPELVPSPGDTATAKSPEQERFDRVLGAAQHIAGNSYAVSDKSFTIFKNADGEYVTRYTSLRDGKVTYVPELKLVQFFGPGQTQNQAPAVPLEA